MTKGKTTNLIRLTQSTTMYFPYFPLLCPNPKTNLLTFSVHAAKTVNSNLANSQEKSYWNSREFIGKTLKIAAITNLLLFKQILN